MNSIVVHYKELALKGRNRPWFIKALVRNLRTSLAGIEIVSVRSVMGRIEIRAGSGASWTEIRERVSRIFGIANFSHAGCAPLEFGPLASAYRLARTELDMIEVQLSRLNPNLPDAEESWSRLSRDAEDAVSREHTLWRARRDRRA